MTLNISYIDSLVEGINNSDKVVEVRKDDAVLRAQFLYLLGKVFGNDCVGSFQGIYGSESISKMLNGGNLSSLLSSEHSYKYQNLVLSKTKRNFLFLKSSQDIVKIEPVNIGQDNCGSFVKNGVYSSLRITAFSEEALERSKNFAIAYKNLSGMNVEIVQSYLDESVLKEVENSVDQKTDLRENKSEVKITNINELVDIKQVSLKKVSDGFVFHNLAGIGSVKLLNDYLDSGSSKKHDDWRAHCAGRSDGIVFPNSVVLYQMFRALYELRTDVDSKSVVDECLALFTQDWNGKYPLTGTKVKYSGGLDAVVDSLQLDGSVRTTNLEVPEFTKLNNVWSYLVLAPEQAEDKLGNINPISENAKHILRELLGEGYEQAGEIFQYLSSRKNGNLREIRLWTPTLANRNIERAVVFGVDDINDYFSIDAYDIMNGDRPSRGVVAVRENL